MIKIIIDPRIKINYASWYILGISLCYGNEAIKYDIKPFLNLKYSTTKDLNSGMALVFEDGQTIKKIFIDFEDIAIIFPDRYEWCDIYAMVNPRREQIANFPKVKAIGPEFGVTLYNSFSSIIQCLTHYYQGRKFNSLPLKLYLRDYLYTNIRRRSLDIYEKTSKTRQNYIFHASTLWYNEFAWTNTNMFRGEFLKAAQKANLDIEGGLYYLGESPSVISEMPDYSRYKTEYKDFIYEKRLSIDEYIQKTKESLLVFNTPAVCECHGWKLAEYLCMGKAIISSPLSRELPSPLIHGKHIHFINNVEEIYDAIIRIKNDYDYRYNLEKGARKYYEEWLAPEVVIRRIFEEQY